MSNSAPILTRLPDTSQELAEEFGRDLFAARKDPSDPEDCFNFLYVLHPERWRLVMANLQGAIHEAGQFYITAEMERA